MMNISTNSLNLANRSACPLFVSLPFTYPRNRETHSGDGMEMPLLNDVIEANYEASRFTELWAILAAIDHVNSQNGTIASVLNEEESPSLPFVPYIVVSDSSKSAQTLYQLLSGNSFDKNSAVVYDILASPNHASIESYDFTKLCGVVGPVSSEDVQPIAHVTNYFGIPQVSHLALDIDIDKGSGFNTFARISVNAEYIARGFLSLMQSLGRNYIGILFDSSSTFSNSVWSSIESLLCNGDNDAQMDASSSCFPLTILGFAYLNEEDHPLSVMNALRSLGLTSFGTVVIIENVDTDYTTLIDSAVELDLLSENYMWIIISNDLVYRSLYDYIDFVKGTSIERLLSGMILFQYTGSHNVVSEDYKNFYRSTYIKTVERVSDASLLNFNTTDILSNSKSEELLDNAGYSYDSVVSIIHGRNINGILQSNFSGASGHVTYIAGSNSRELMSSQFSISNLQSDMECNEGNDICTVSYRVVEVSQYNDGKWDFIENVTYFDGSSHPPPLRNVVEDMNYIPDYFRYFALGLVCFGVLSCLVLSFMVRQKCDRWAVRYAQPQFLISLCISTALIFISSLRDLSDERVGIIDGYLDLCCSVFISIRIWGMALCSYSIFVKVSV